MKHIFISYSRKDIAAMQNIVKVLQSHRIKVWTDEKLTPGTNDWKIALEKAIENSGAVIALLSPDAKSSEWCAREIAYARVRKIMVFPLLLQGDERSSIPLELANSQWLDMRDETQFPSGIERLVQSIHTLLEAKEKSKYQHIHDALVQLVEKVPAISSVALVTVDGLTTGFYSVSPTAEEDRISAMSAALLSTGERIAREIGLGDVKFTIVSGEQGLMFEVSVGLEHVLIAICYENIPVLENMLAALTETGRLLVDLV